MEKAKQVVVILCLIILEIPFLQNKQFFYAEDVMSYKNTKNEKAQAFGGWQKVVFVFIAFKL